MKWFFALLLLINSMHAYSIVFVHIGSKLPRYLVVAIEQARLFNPDCPIYLIANKKAFKKSSSTLEKVECISCESLLKSPAHKLFRASSNLDRKSFDGFWLYTSERFFYLEELIRQKQLSDVFHIENDVMLYADLSSLLPTFHQHYKGMIGATFDSDSRCIPGFVYISDLEPIDQLTQFVASRATAGENDMEILQSFKALHHSVYIEHLPIIFPQYDMDWGLKNAKDEITLFPERYSQNFADFKSIFDAAAIGQYLGGISPRNGPRVDGFVNETCLFNPEHLNLKWKKDSKKRLVPYVEYSGEDYPINNLHIHSKNLIRFYSGRK